MEGRDWQAGGEGAGGPRLSVIVPCYNEEANIRPLYTAVCAACSGQSFELIFVDDRLIVTGLGGLVWMSIGVFIMAKMVSFEI